MSDGVWRDAVRLSIGTLSALPVPAPEQVDRHRAGRAMALAPVVGLLPGAAGALTVAVATWVGLAPLPVAVLAVAAGVLASRGVHLDGLADTADGLAASYQRERALEVMRTGGSGPAGVAAVVLVLGLQLGALAQLVEQRGAGRAAVAAAVAALAGRAVLPVLCMRGVPAARPGGLGATVAGSVPRRWAAGAAAAAAALAALLTAAAGLAGPGRTDPIAAVVAAAASVPAAILVAAALGRRACTRLGGITGDVLGAAVELGTATALLLLAAAGHAAA